MSKKINIIVPPLGDSVTEATIAKWHKKIGEYVQVDELLVELETDKITLEVNAPATGVIEAIPFPEGSVVMPNAILGSIEEKEVSQNAATKAVLSATIKPEKSEVIASPAAAKMARENNITLATVQGSGKDGRIAKHDVLAASGEMTPTSKETNVVVPNAIERVQERIPMTKLRQAIARRLKESQNTAAILTTFNEVNMRNVMSLRAKYQEAFTKEHGVKLGFMSFFVKAVIKALKALPAVNAEINGTDLLFKKYYDIGVAVGTEQGVVVPVLRNADTMSFGAIESNIAAYGKKAREGKLSAADMSGGTFSITNGGIYGSLLSTPIINPPQSGILGMHNITERAVVIDGQIVAQPMMYIALSYDHRIIDGREAVTFLVIIKNAIENPESLLFDV